EQDEPGHRAGSRVDRAAASADGVVSPHLAGLPIHKMTGSGNDFVMVHGRLSAPKDWSAAVTRATCARGTGVGADGVVFLQPGSGPDCGRMIYFNSDGARAALCGNAALCSTRLAGPLGLATGGSMRLETDAGTCDGRLAAVPDRADLQLTPVAAPHAHPHAQRPSSGSPSNSTSGRRLWRCLADRGSEDRVQGGPKLTYFSTFTHILT